ncbi:hypothetical protein [Candidatus Ruminimicrobiellum ovillum]|uniref:hypothetical protein n=1 Tax=Candidatus Ruminimicrobiellum ovillum TaxID=1947927 RepID=UPI00355A67AB
MSEEVKETENKINNPQENIVQNNEQTGKSVQENIANVVEQYSSFKNQVRDSSLKRDSANKKFKKNKEHGFSDFIVSVITLVFLLVLLCGAIAYIAKPEIDAESEKITKQISDAETTYFGTFGKFHYLNKVGYSNTLGINLAKSKYFTAFEVVPDEKKENCEIRLYGATDAFTMAYCYVKNFINNNF